MPENSPIPKIAIFISTALKGARSTLRGIFDYAAAHGPWFCMFMEGRPGEQLLDLAKDGGADGVIVTGLTRPGVRDIAAFHAPVVFVEPWPDMIAPDFPMQDVPWVGRDSHAIGEMAARYYLERGYTSFAFVGEPGGLYWSAERRRGFAETVAAAGFGCKVRDSFTEEEKRSWAVERKSLVRFLRGLPKPTAVFAPMDGRARLVLEACLVGGIKVPEEIAVLGVDNDPLLCESTVPALSSIHTGGYRRGQIAAAMLDDLMHGRKPKECAVALPPLSVVTRGSTGYEAMKNPAIARAVTFIRSHAATGGVSVPAVARAAGCSRSYLDKHFRSGLGLSVREAVLRERIERVKTLVSSTNRTMTEIAADCGFARDSHLARLFKETTGLTMRQWRRENHETPDE